MDLKNTTPLISVNITTFNRADFLPRCLNSIIKQSYKNLEIIIVDDFSADNTKQIIQPYLQKDNRITYLKHSENKGNAAARNTAWENSNGTFIAMMDDDDIWIDPDKILKQVQVFNKDKYIELVCSNVRVNYGDKIISKNLHKLSDITDKLSMGNGVIFSPTVMVKKELLIELGGFDEKLHKGVDADFFRRAIVWENKKFHIMPDFTTEVIISHQNRLTVSVTEERIRKSINTYNYLIQKNEKYIAQKRIYKTYWYNVLLKQYLNMHFYYQLDKKTRKEALLLLARLASGFFFNKSTLKNAYRIFRFSFNF